MDVLRSLTVVLEWHLHVCKHSYTLNDAEYVYRGSKCIMLYRSQILISSWNVEKRQYVKVYSGAILREGAFIMLVV